MTKQQVIEKIGNTEWSAFCEFMTGQTVGVYPDGTADFYEDDVQRFVDGLSVID